MSFSKEYLYVTEKVITKTQNALINTDYIDFFQIPHF